MHILFDCRPGTKAYIARARRTPRLAELSKAFEVPLYKALELMRSGFPDEALCVLPELMRVDRNFKTQSWNHISMSCGLAMVSPEFRAAVEQVDFNTVAFKQIQLCNPDNESESRTYFWMVPLVAKELIDHKRSTEVIYWPETNRVSLQITGKDRIVLLEKPDETAIWYDPRRSWNDLFVGDQIYANLNALKPKLRFGLQEVVYYDD